MGSEACLTCGSLAAALAQVGTMMAEFPLDPQLAKMMVTAPEYRSAPPPPRSARHTCCVGHAGPGHAG